MCRRRRRRLSVPLVAGGERRRNRPSERRPTLCSTKKRRLLPPQQTKNFWWLRRRACLKKKKEDQKSSSDRPSALGKSSIAGRTGQAGQSFPSFLFLPTVPEKKTFGSSSPPFSLSLSASSLFVRMMSTAGIPAIPSPSSPPAQYGTQHCVVVATGQCWWLLGREKRGRRLTSPPSPYFPSSPSSRYIRWREE